MGRIVIYSGPAAVSRHKLFAAIERSYPRVASRIRSVVLSTSRRIRANEVNGVDYHFTDKGSIEGLKGMLNYFVYESIGTAFAIDLDELRRQSSADDSIVLLRVPAKVGAVIAGHPYLEGTDIQTVFLSPIRSTQILAKKLLGGTFTRTLIEDQILKYVDEELILQARKGKMIGFGYRKERIRSAFNELMYAPHFRWVIPSLEGSVSPSWEAENVSGLAKKTLRSFIDVLDGKKPRYFDRWLSKVLA